MYPSLCLYGLIFLNFVEAIPSLVEEYYDYDVSESQNYEDIKTNTEFTSLEETKNMSEIENLAMESEEFGENITSKETLTAGSFEEDNASKDLSTETDLDETYDIFTTLFKDFSKEMDASKEDVSRQIEDSKEPSIEMADLDNDIVKEELTEESITEKINSEVKSECDENIFEERANLDEGETVTSWKLVELDVMDGLEAIEEVERNSRALGSGLKCNFCDSDRNNRLCSGAPVKQLIPAKGKVRIVGTFNNFQGNMPTTITTNGNKEILYGDNIAIENEPKYDSVKLERLLHRDNVHKADKKVLRKVPVTGKFTVAAKFC